MKNEVFLSPKQPKECQNRLNSKLRRTTIVICCSTDLGPFRHLYFTHYRAFQHIQQSQMLVLYQIAQIARFSMLLRAQISPLLQRDHPQNLSKSPKTLGQHFISIKTSNYSIILQIFNHLPPKP